MTPEELEQHAEDVLADVPDWLWNGEDLPVPIDQIAGTCFGLLVRKEEDMTNAPGAPPLREGQTISGLLLPSRGEIWVNAEEARGWKTRMRFTIGHELGHWCLHRSEVQQSLFCRRTAIDEGDQPDKKASSIEEEANVFAAAVLMPRHLMQQHYERLRREDGCFERMCKLFGASQMAMGRRMHTAIE